jgi:hypothetical protein
MPIFIQTDISAARARGKASKGAAGSASPRMGQSKDLGIKMTFGAVSWMTKDFR